jgi:diguanylate cyclase (GGDEF)-like protein
VRDRAKNPSSSSSSPAALSPSAASSPARGRRAPGASATAATLGAGGPHGAAAHATASLVVQAVFLSAVGLAAWWTTRWWIERGGASAMQVALGVILPLCVGAIVATVLLGQQRYWMLPRRRLRGLIRDVRAGRMPIDALRDVGGGLAGVADDVASLLRDHRQLQKRLAEKDHEADQRVASKADALNRVIGSLRLQAIRDPLTGLFNRRALDELLPRLIDHCRAAGDDLSLLMIDVDHFKPLNDNLGHAAGDEMLRSIAQIIRSGVRTSQDAAFRCGGDEFVVVMPGCAAASAQALADRLAALVANLARTVRVTPRPGLSVGVCSITELPSPTALSLIQEADRRLYEVKHRRKAGER